MLTQKDIEFIMQVMDKTNFTGIQSAMMASEVFLKLGQMRDEQIRAARRNAGDAPVVQEEVVQE